MVDQNNTLMRLAIVGGQTFVGYFCDSLLTQTIHFPFVLIIQGRCISALSSVPKAIRPIRFKGNTQRSRNEKEGLLSKAQLCPRRHQGIGELPPPRSVMLSIQNTFRDSDHCRDTQWPWHSTKVIPRSSPGHSSARTRAGDEASLRPMLLFPRFSCRHLFPETLVCPGLLSTAYDNSQTGHDAF